jgi:hypothetical protein
VVPFSFPVSRNNSVEAEFSFNEATSCRNKRLRYFLHRDPGVRSAALRIVLRGIEPALREQSPAAGPSAQIGAVWFRKATGRNPATRAPVETVPPEQAQTELRDLRKAVEALATELRQGRRARGPAKDQRQAIDVILKHIQDHGPTLWGHVVALPEQAGGAIRVVDRIPCRLQSRNGELKHGERRRSGRKKLTQNLENLPPPEPLLPSTCATPTTWPWHLSPIRVRCAVPVTAGAPGARGESARERCESLHLLRSGNAKTLTGPRSNLPRASVWHADCLLLGRTRQTSRTSAAREAEEQAHGETEPDAFEVPTYHAGGSVWLRKTMQPFMDPAAVQPTPAANHVHYERRRPEETTLYPLVQENAATFFAQVEAETGAGLPDFVKAEFEAFLDCGILANGFLRLRCQDCAHEKLVAFSCKRRGFCPACGARRMAETAAHRVDHVIPRVPVRQWVLSFPIPLRFLLAAHPHLLSPVLQLVYRAISTFLMKQAGLTRSQAATGAVTLIQRFGSAAHLNIHLHCLVLDGV